MSKRMAPADRKAEILSAAVAEASRLGYNTFRLVDVAKRAECSNALVMNYWKTMEQLRRAVMGEAIRTEELRIIAVGVALNDPRCKRLKPELRARALQSL